MNEIQIRVVEGRLWLRNVRLRMPFRFGSARMTVAPIGHLRIVVEDTGGRTAWGVSADILPPAWFDKRPGRTQRQDIEELLLSVDNARRLYLAQAAATPFALWHAVERPAIEAGRAGGLAPLTAGFGLALFERAVLDAVARLKGRPAWDIVNENALGVDLGALDINLAGTAVTDVLPSRPLESVWARHTVGLSDPLTAGDIASGQALHDGLPQTLEQAIQQYGLLHFKLKIGGDPQADLDRLERIAAVLGEAPTLAVTLDGNEQYHSWDAVEELAAGLQARKPLQRLARAVRYIEQPLYREQALAPEGAQARAAVGAWRPLLIDESDDTPATWPEAARLGYRGVSFKACKGFLRGLRNKALAQAWSRAGRGDFVISSEDLTALPLVPLHQHLALGALLGIESQERNGLHYTHGLSWLTPAEQRQALLDHPDLYCAAGGFPHLRVEGGRLALASLLRAPGLALGSAPPWKALTPAEDWVYESLEAE